MVDLGQLKPTRNKTVGSVALRLSHHTVNTKVVGSNPLLDTLGKVSLTSSSGQPKPCEGNWVVSSGS